VNDPLAALLADDALVDISTRPMAELRSFRFRASRVEGDISLVRRIAQGRLDIIGHEVRRRAGDGDPAQLNDLLYDLPEILSDPAEASGPSGRAVEINDPGEVAALMGAELDAVISPRELSGVGELADDHLFEVLQRVESMEEELSQIRRQLHDRIDAVQHEIGRRYRDGEASVEGLGR
jgi:hypothetical protein